MCVWGGGGGCGCVHVCAEKKESRSNRAILQFTKCVPNNCKMHCTKFDHHWPIRMPQSMIPLTNQNLLTHIPPEVHVSEVYARGVAVHLLQEEDSVDNGVLQLQ